MTNLCSPHDFYFSELIDLVLFVFVRHIVLKSDRQSAVEEVLIQYILLKGALGVFFFSN